MRLSGDQDRLVSRSPDGRTLAVLSWDILLSVIHIALEAAGEFDNLADLRQLTALVRKMDADGFRPLVTSQLTGDTPRLILSLCDLTDAVIQDVLRWPFANRRNLRAAAGKGWYGHYFRLHGFGCQLLVTATRWQASGRSPIWLRVSSSKWDVPTGIRAVLALAVPDSSWIEEDRRREWAGYWLPVVLLEGREREPVVADILRQIKLVADALGPHALPDSAIQPDSATAQVPGVAG